VSVMSDVSVSRSYVSRYVYVFTATTSSLSVQATSGSGGELLRGRGLPPFRGDDRAHSYSHGQTSTQRGTSRIWGHEGHLKGVRYYSDKSTCMTIDKTYQGEFRLSNMEGRGVGGAGAGSQ
jgi:hypothetical protein